MSDAGRSCDAVDAIRAVFPDGHSNGQMAENPTTPALTQIRAAVEVVVGPGITTSQGRLAPEFGFATTRPDMGDAGNLALEGQAWDLDGFVHTVGIDWGDGTSPTTVANPLPCRTADNGWPLSSPIWMLPRSAALSANAGMVAHQYAVPGAYTLTVTVESAGCDGQDEQRMTGTLTGQTLPPPDPPPPA